MSQDQDKSSISIGTSGWSYDDWVGPFYPDNLRTKKSDWLEYYGKYFSTTEINSTFYRMPNEKMVNRWIEVGSKLQPFEFSVKLPQSVTHEALVEGKRDEAQKIAGDFERIVATPLAEAGLMGCILIQLSPFFQRYDKKSKADNLDSLKILFEALSYSDRMYVAEFRHSSWLNERRDDLQDETLELLREYNIGLCKTDGPGFPVTTTNTAPHSYIRFHGRNSDIWFKAKKWEEEKKLKGPEFDKRMNRYDFMYSEDQLKGWVPTVKKSIEKKGSSGHLYFNNHPQAQAVQNAFMMMDLVGLPRKLPGFNIKRQEKLNIF